MDTVYLVSFIVGLLLSLVLAFAGNVHLSFGHHGGHVGVHGGHQHAAGHHAAGHHAAVHHDTASAAQSVLGFVLTWISPVTIGGALLLFGGIGLLAGSSALALPAAIVAGIAGALILRTFMGALVKASSDPLVLTGDGAYGTVNATIHPGATGEVVYTLEGLHRSAIARSEEQVEIPRGTPVVITRRDRGIAWVEPLEPLPARKEVE
ncbi:MAG: hypothetical protein NVS2B16_22090 [Chloroflexota bacterium]